MSNLLSKSQQDMEFSDGQIKRQTGRGGTIYRWGGDRASNCRSLTLLALQGPGEWDPALELIGGGECEEPLNPAQQAL